jgi:type IV secretory pathway TrbD component
MPASFVPVRAPGKVRTLRAVIAPGPDRRGRRTRLLLLVGIGSVLGLAALVHGLVTSLWASAVVGVVLLVVAAYCAVVLWRLRRDAAS